MHPWRIMLGVAALVAALGIGGVRTFASPFVVFPKAGELISPNGRLAVRNSDRVAASSEFDGTFHSLWLFELSTGRSRKLCDYVGVAAVGWSNNEYILVTQYLGKRTSRALIFPMASLDNAIMLDKNTITGMVPVELRPELRDNDHVFVEGSRIEQDTLHLTVWGYGQHDASGFRWRCEYTLSDGKLSCTEERGAL